MRTDEDVASELSPESRALRAKLDAHERGEPVYALSTAERTKRTGSPVEVGNLPPRRLFLKAELVAAGAAAHGNWIRQRGASRERRSQASQKARGTRAGPSRRRSDDPPPLARIRGFAAASARMIVHLDRRRAAMRLA